MEDSQEIGIQQRSEDMELNQINQSQNSQDTAIDIIEADQNIIQANNQQNFQQNNQAQQKYRSTVKKIIILLVLCFFITLGFNLFIIYYYNIDSDNIDVNNQNLKKNYPKNNQKNEIIPNQIQESDGEINQNQVINDGENTSFIQQNDNLLQNQQDLQEINNSTPQKESAILKVLEHFDQEQYQNLTQKSDDQNYFDEQILWGHYKPHLLYSISQRNTNPLAINIGYSNPLKQNQQFYLFTDKKNNLNIKQDFTQNDGQIFSNFKIQDPKIGCQIDQFFVKTKTEKHQQQWIQENIVTKYEDQMNQESYFSLIFMFAYEVYDPSKDTQIKMEFSYLEKHIQIDFYSQKSHLLYTDKKNNIGHATIYFEEINEDLQKFNKLDLDQLINDKSITYFTKKINTSQTWNSKKEILKMDNQTKIFKTQKYEYIFNNQLENDSTMVGLQIRINPEFLSTPGNKNQNKQQNNNKFRSVLIFDSIDPKYDNLEFQEFQNYKNKILNFQNNTVKSFIDNDQISIKNQKCANHALSNLMGGLVYKYGDLQFTQSMEALKQKPKPIFSFTPSRTRFGWSFLWDDGFHNQVICKMSPNICAKTIESWFQTINSDGWIPREQPRGSEAKGLCNCPNFEKKDNRDGNPPSLLLPLQYLINNTELQQQNQIIVDFLKNNYENVKLWFNWYLNNLQNSFLDQKDLKYIFKWWDQTDSNRISMNSGLDDFPRNFKNINPNNIIPGAHIDLQSWMYYFSTVMVEYSQFMNDETDQQKFKDIQNQIKQNTNQYFYDKQSNTYMDILIHPRERKLENRQFTNHQGYPSLLPLAFGLIENNSEELKGTLDLIEDPQRLWTNFGLRSLSKSSTMFRQNNNYWTSPIWIQMNYLVLKGLHQYYSDNQQAKNIYTKLRHNLIQNVCGNYEKSGYFYENYNKNQNGEGSDAVHFTGWTSTIALIISENYK